MSLGCVSVQFFLRIVCHDDCGNCDGSSQNMCTSCKGTKILFNGKCLSECPVGYYLNENKCIPCTPPCIDCLSSTICMKCSSPLFNLGNECVSGFLCPDGTYSNTNTLSCLPCSSICSTCHGPTKSDCIKCNHLKGYQKNNENSGECFKLSCEEGQYISIDLEAEIVSCLPCKKACKACTSLNDCTECKSGYIHKANSLCVGCPNGFEFSKEGVCKGIYNLFCRNLW